jgi:hypothetical protein
MRTEYRVSTGSRAVWTDADDERDALALADALDKYYRGLHMFSGKAQVQKRLVSDWRDVPRGKRRAR